VVSVVSYQLAVVPAPTKLPPQAACAVAAGLAEAERAGSRQAGSDGVITDN
jgi:hypothetical protein